MSLDNDLIQLLPLQSPLVNEVHVQIAWDLLMQNSVEVITAGLPSVYEFADQNCLSFFAIQHLFDPDAREGERRRLFCEDPEALEADLDPFSDPESSETVGIIYLTMSHVSSSSNVGVVLLPEARMLGLGRQATWLMINWAFNELGCHRIQAQIVDGDPDLRDISLGLFTGLGFSHEGSLRRAVFYPTSPTQSFPTAASGEWRDIINLAILDMDWVVRSETPRIPRQLVKSRWDELFARHERERQAMLHLEEWEEERRSAAGQAAGTGARAMIFESTARTFESMESLSELESIWETSSQASSTRSWADDHSRERAERTYTERRSPPASAAADTPVSGSGGPKKAARNKRARAPRSTRNYFQQGGALEAFAGHAATPSVNHIFNNMRGSTPTPSGEASPATRSTLNTLKRSASASPQAEESAVSSATGARGEGLRRRRPLVWEAMSSCTSSADSSSDGELSDWVADFFSDVESVPRSPSVASTRSHSLASTADSWDAIETMSTGSYEIPNFAASDAEE